MQSQESPVAKDGVSHDCQLEYLRKKLEENELKLKSAAAWLHNGHYLTQMAAVFLSAVISILAGFKGALFGEGTRSNSILVLGALTTVISAWGAFFAARERYELCAETSSRLTALTRRLEFMVRSPEFSKEPALPDPVFDEFQAILAEHNRRFFETQKKPRASIV